MGAQLAYGTLAVGRSGCGEDWIDLGLTSPACDLNLRESG
jgi:hypothetical protein